MRYGEDTVHQVRSIMAPGNPVPSDAPTASWHDAHARETYEMITKLLPAEPSGSAGVAARTQVRSPGTRPLVSGKARKVAAPVTAALAVAGVVAAVTLAAANSGNAPRHLSVTGASTGQRTGGRSTNASLPAFYVTLSLQGNQGAVIAEVHSSQTGQVLSHMRVGYDRNGMNISADDSDQAFVMDAAAPNARADKNVLSLLRISANGTSITQTMLHISLLPANSPDVVDGIAVSPDGTQLAVALQLDGHNTRVLRPHGEILLYSLKSHTVSRRWNAPADAGVPWDPAWTGGNLNFVWQDQLNGNQWFYDGNSQVRTLNTTAAGSNLLSSSTLLVSGGGKVGFIQAAYAGPAGAPVIAATFQVTSVGGTGTATVQLIELSTTGTVMKVLAQHSYAYSGATQEGIDVAGCQVAGLDASAQDTLAYCPSFGSITNGMFKPLAHNPSGAVAAW